MPPSADENCPNPLLLSWVKEWLDVARERNSKGVTTYRNAYNALKACPLKMTHPCQLQNLKGFGPKLCDRLTEKLKKHCEENGLPMPRKTMRNPALAALNGDSAGDFDDDDEDGAPRPQPTKKARKVKPYVPQYRSGPYGLILGLAEHNASGIRGLSKTELIDAAQAHCDTSYRTSEQANGFYTAWNSMKALINKELVVEKKAGPRKFYVLTDAGFEVARNMRRAINPDTASPGPPDESEPPRQPIGHDDVFSLESGREETVQPSTRPLPNTQSQFVDIVKDADSGSDPTNISNFRPIRLQPGTFTVQLVIDTREIRSKTDRDYMQEELNKQDIKPIVKALELGDALWVAKCHDPNLLSRTGAEGDEVVLDWIVERKRLDDLIGSIKDGRFHEQKFRLKKSGIKNVIYIVEEFNLDERNRSSYELSIQSAIATTQVVNGFFVKQTQKMDDTIRYLVRMTKKLKKQYEDKPLFVIPTGIITRQNYLPLLNNLREKDPCNGHYVSYPAFSSLASKSEMMTLRDLYLRFLMCTRGVTGEKALEIQKKWKTPHEFIKAFETFGPDEAGKKRKREMVFGELGQQFGRKKITRPLSGKIADIWG
jgi:crossover junction endonuclease MUS81